MALRDFKTAAVVTIPGSSETPVFVATKNNTVAHRLRCVNSTATPSTVTVWHLPSGTGAGAIQYIIKHITLAQFEDFELVNTHMSTGDTLLVSLSSAGPSVTVNYSEPGA